MSAQADNYAGCEFIRLPIQTTPILTNLNSDKRCKSIEKIKIIPKKIQIPKSRPKRKFMPDAGRESQIATEPNIFFAQQLADSQEKKIGVFGRQLENYKRQTARLFGTKSATAPRAAPSRICRPRSILLGVAMQYADQAKSTATLKTRRKQMASALESAGIEAIPAVGEKFDPQKHEAIEEVESELESGKVARKQCGYLYKGSVLRPAIVKVAK